MKIAASILIHKPNIPLILTALRTLEAAHPDQMPVSGKKSPSRKPRIKPGQSLAAHHLRQTILQSIRDDASKRAKRYREKAFQKQDDGTLEVDEGAIVSLGDDDGSYVMSWLWISDEEL